MDDFQFILYIIFFVIYLVSRVLKGNKKKAAPKPRPRQTPHYQPEAAEEEKPMTFQDILKQIGREIEKEVAPTNTPQEPEYEEENVFTHEMDDEIKQTFEQSVQDAKRYQTIDEAVDLNDDKFRRLEVYKIAEEEDESDFINELKEDFKNPDSIKKAIIYKEILDRRF